MTRRRFVDLSIIATLGTATLIMYYLRAIRVEIAFPLTVREWESYQLRGNQVGEVIFSFATCFGWFGAAYYFAGRWAERKW